MDATVAYLPQTSPADIVMLMKRVTSRMPRALALSRANREAFGRAEALGWREPKLN